MNDPAWLTPDISLSVMPPIVNTASARDDRDFGAIVDQFKVESSERYRVRDIDGDGKLDTFCNIYVSDLTAALCAPVPHRLNGEWQNVHANADWLRSGRNGWHQCSSVTAQKASDIGYPSVVVYDPPDVAHGHIALLIPSEGRAGIWITQAGARNYRRAPLLAGFGFHADSVVFFTHP